MCKIHILFICEDVSYIKCKIRGYTISYCVFIYVEIILLDRLVITSNKIIFVTLLLSLVNLLSSNINISLSPKRLKLLGSEPAYFFSFPNKYISHGIKVSLKVKSEKRVKKDRLFDNQIPNPATRNSQNCPLQI